MFMRMNRGKIISVVALFSALPYIFPTNGNEVHTVKVKPNDKKLVAIPVTGPYTGELHIKPVEGGKLVTSGIKIQDNMHVSALWLWTPGEKNQECHKYLISKAYSRQEFVSITGIVTTAGTGGGKGKIPPFQVTVPEVDVDWEGFEAWEMERTEDSNLVFLPVATTDAGRRKLFVRVPREKDDGMFLPEKRVLPDLYLSWSSGIQLYTNNVPIPSPILEIKSNNVKSWPLVFYASQDTTVPVPAGEMAIRLERKPTKYDVNGEITFDEIKCKGLRLILKNDNTLVNPDDFVYIQATPQMPQLVASLEPKVLPNASRMRLHIEYTRNRNDHSYYPGPTAVTWEGVPSGMEWNITNDIGDDFRGGRATLYCEYLGEPLQMVFHIRGNNPTEATVRAEIGTNPWYAIPIAKHESDRPSQGRFFAQFNTIGVLGPNPDDYRYCPNFGAPNGWGIFQLDTPNPGAQELWNWRTNVADGKARLANPCLTEAQVWIASQEEQQQQEEPTKPLENVVFTFNGVAFQEGTARTPIDACAIQRYNGAAQRVIYWKNKTATEPGSWEINEAYRAYVDAVCVEIQ